MVSYFVRYRGTAPDPASFYRYYEEQHAAILRRFSNIRSLVLHQPLPFNDPFPVNHGNTFLLAEMKFDTSSDLDAALRSPARAEARDDFHRFPNFTGEVTHEALARKVIF